MSFETIKDIVDFNPSRPLSKGKEFPFIDMASLPVNGRDINEVSNKVFNGGGAKFKNGDTLFARITPCLENGKTAKVENLPVGCIAHGSTEFIVLSAKSKDDEDFVYYLARLPDFRSYAISRMEGTSGRQRVSWQALAEFNLRLPEKGKRKKIGKILKSLDDKIHLNNQINQTLESIAQTIFKSWFIDFEPVRAKIIAKQEGKDTELAAMCAISGKSEVELQQMAEDDLAELQETASLFPDELVESELGEVPKGWSITKVDDILNRMKIKKRFKKNDVNEFGRTFVLEQGSNVILGFHNEEGSIPASKEEPAFIFGDHTCITKLMLSNFDVSENVIAVTGKERNSYWTYYAIKDLQKFQEYRRHWMELTSKQVVVADINLTDYFAKKVKILHEEIEYSVRENLVLMNLRNTLLPKLLSGEMEVSILEGLS